MRQGGRWLVPLLLTVPLAGSPGDGLPDYASDLLADAPLGVDRDSDGIPDGWSEAAGNGFRAFPGSIGIEGKALRLFMNGRNVGVEILRPLPLQSGSAYRIEGQCRAQGLRKGTPEVSVRWLDQAGHALGVESRTLSAGAEWRTFSLPVDAAPPEARTMALRLAALGSEVSGTVWFKDVALFRTPRLSVEGFAPGHLVSLPGPAALTLALGGVDAGSYRLEASLRDIDGRTAWRQDQPLDLAKGVARVPVQVALPAEGAFRLVFSLSASGRQVLSHETALNILSPLPPVGGEGGAGGAPAGLAGVCVTPNAEGLRSQIELLEQMAPDLALVQVEAPGARTTWGQNPADPMLRNLSKRGVRCAGLFVPGPDAKAAAAELHAALMRYFGEVDTWVLREPLGGLDPRAIIIPRPIQWGVQASSEAKVGSERWKTVPLRDSEGSRQDLRAFSLEALGELLSGRTLLLRLDTGPGGLLAPDGGAKPEFLAWRVLSRVLRQARDPGEIPLDPDVEARALRQGDRTLIIAWTRRTDGERLIPLPAAQSVAAVDLMGRVEMLNPERGQVTLKVGDLPRCFFIVSSGWLKTRASMRLDHDVAAAGSPSLRTFSFENSFDTLLAGTLRLSGPPGWRVEPSSLPVAVPPGGTFTAQVRLFPAPFEVTGNSGSDKHLEVELSLGDGSLAPMRAFVMFRLLPPAIENRLSATRQPEGDLALVSQEITNHGDAPVACDAFLSARGRPEQRHPLGRLEPGERRHVEYAIPWETLQEGDTVAGVREISGQRRFVIGELRGE